MGLTICANGKHFVECEHLSEAKETNFGQEFRRDGKRLQRRCGAGREEHWHSGGNGMKLPALAVLATCLSLPAYAEKVTIGCPLVTQYSENEVNYLIGEARSAVGEQEAGRIYAHYLDLRSACRVNDGAVRTVTVSPTLRDWLAQNGVDIRRFARRL
jgi:hypothetical protein